MVGISTGGQALRDELLTLRDMVINRGDAGCIETQACSGLVLQRYTSVQTLPRRLHWDQMRQPWVVADLSETQQEHTRKQWDATCER